MLPIHEYFNPVSLEPPHGDVMLDDELFCKHITVQTPDNPILDVTGFNVALIGVPEERASYTKGCAQSPDKIREQLFQLNYVNKKLRIVDLGNLKPGVELRDTYFGLRDVVCELISKGVVPVIIGGSQDLSLSICQAYEYLEREYTFTTIDYKIDFAPELYPATSTSKNYMNTLILENKHLFEYINLGNQACFLSPSDFHLFETLFHEFVRLGQLRNNTSFAEHYLRDTDFLSIDLSAVKHADAPGQSVASPNGFNAEEICQLAHYAGISEKLSAFGVFEFSPLRDINNVTASLAAQTIWYFLDAISMRKPEEPKINPGNFVKYFVSFSDSYQLNFYKSPLTQRWWVEVPFGDNQNRIIACSEADYIKASNNEIPDRWLKFFKKLN